MQSPTSRILTVLALCATLLLAACGGGTPAAAPTEAPRPTTAPRPTRTPRPTEAPRPTEPPPTSDKTYEAGEPIEIGNLMLTVNDAVELAPDDFSKPEAGNRFIAVDVTFENNGKEKHVLSTLLQMRLENSKGEKYDVDIMAASLAGDTIDGDLAPGDSKTGRIGFQVPEQASDLLFVFEDPFEGKAVVALPAIKPAAETGSTSTGASGALATVEVGRLVTYEHSSGVFKLRVPEAWEASDTSKPDEIIVVWTDPTNNALIGVDIFDSEEKTDDELIDFLKTYLQNTFGDQPDFSLNDPKLQQDGSILMVWSYTAKAAGGVQAKLLGNTFIWQPQGKTALMTTLVPADQFEALKSETDTIINSIIIDETVAIGEDGSSSPGDTLKEVVIGDLQTYTYPTGVFSIDVPENWEIQDTSKADEVIIVWTDPAGNALIGVDIFEQERELTADELSELLQKYLQNTFGSQPDFDTDEPKPQSDGSTLIVWSYTANADNDVKASLNGNSFIEQRGNKVSILTTLVPQDQFDQLLPETNKIINTFKIDPSAPLS